MNPQAVIDLFRASLELMATILAVLIVPGLLVGLLVSIFQAATQINEQTLSFVPKLVVTFCAALFGGPWLLNLIINYTQNLFMNLSSYIT